MNEATQNNKVKSIFIEPLTAKDQFLSVKEVSRITNMSRSKIYKMAKAGKFPALIKLGASSAWSLNEVNQWMEDRLNERQSA